MKLEEQVCSLELSKKLKELGVKQESLFVWYHYIRESLGEDIDRWILVPSSELNHEVFSEITSAFTVAELYSLSYGLGIDVSLNSDDYMAHELCNYLAEQIIWHIENGKVKV
jgi:hypothetical protein